MGFFYDSELKIKRIEDFEKKLQRELAHFTPPPGTPKFYPLPIDNETRKNELKHFSRISNFLPEDFYIWQLIRFLFENVLSTKLSAAKGIFNSLYLPTYGSLDIDLGKVLGPIYRQNRNRRFIHTYLFDFYPRPPFTRSNPFCVIGNKRHKPGKFEKSLHSWVDQKSVLFTFESTIDLWPGDIGISPLPLDYRPHWKLPKDSRFDFSFCGVTCYDSMPSNHIRGIQNEPTWRNLGIKRKSMKAFIGTIADAKKKFGSNTDFRDFTANSDFTLCPAGWARWSFRTFEAIKDGSIPLLLSDFYIPPFSKHLPWHEFSMTIPESHLSNIPSIIENFGEAKRKKMREQVKINSARISSIKGLAELICLELRDKF